MRACATATLLVLAAVLVTSCSRRDTTDDGLGQAAITVQEPQISPAPAGKGGPGETEPVAGPVAGPAAKGVPSPYPATAPQVQGETAGTDPAGQPLYKVQVRKAPEPAEISKAGDAPEEVRLPGGRTPASVAANKALAKQRMLEMSARPKRGASSGAGMPSAAEPRPVITKMMTKVQPDE